MMFRKQKKVLLEPLPHHSTHSWVVPKYYKYIFLYNFDEYFIKYLAAKDLNWKYF